MLQKEQTFEYRFDYYITTKSESSPHSFSAHNKSIV